MSNTEQERVQRLAEKHGATSYRNRADTQNPAFGFTPSQLAALIAEVEQAARRATVVPTHRTESALDALDAEVSKMQPGRSIHWIGFTYEDRLRVIAAALAAAPQPPEGLKRENPTTKPTTHNQPR